MHRKGSNINDAYTQNIYSRDDGVLSTDEPRTEEQEEEEGGKKHNITKTTTMNQLLNPNERQRAT